MIKEELKKKYAYTLARVGLNVQPGQTVLVEAAIEAETLYLISLKSVINQVPVMLLFIIWTYRQ